MAFSLALVPSIGDTAEELHAIKDKAPANRMYERAVEFFTKKFPETFRERLANSSKYIDMINDVFSEKGIPAELAYLPFIESGFSPLSVSPQGTTVGLWQFVTSTARRYGLRIDPYVDERKDPVKSTEAAAQYLSDLYSIFGAWDLTVAAFNAGEGRMRGVRDIYRSKSTPTITKQYIPKLLAVFALASDPEQYGFELNETVESQPDYHEVTTNGPVALKSLARRYRTTSGEIKLLNPALLTEWTPPYKYTIRVPVRSN
jgi:membrane-bound lytic murein transglycosylase D